MGRSPGSNKKEGAGRSEALDPDASHWGKIIGGAIKSFSGTGGNGELNSL